MIPGKCPICARAYEIATLDDLPTFPFCSERCRLIDLGRWVDGDYAIPGRENPQATATNGSLAHGDDEEVD